MNRNAAPSPMERLAAMVTQVSSNRSPYR
jgi:hypothetical protein